jgi:hypothetical protein
MARPRIFDPYKLAEELEKYILTAYPFPILAEFAVNYDISREYIYELGKQCEELSYAIKKCHIAKEYKLEKGMATGEINPGYGNFALKQLGWRDKIETEHSGSIGIADALLEARKRANESD